MSFTKNQIIIIGAVLLLVIIIILGVLGVIPIFNSGGSGGDPNYPTDSVKIDFWGVGDQTSYFEQALSSYKAIHENVEVVYKEFDSLESYQKELFNALAEKRGPDIFMIPAAWPYEHWGKMSAAPSTIISAQTVSKLFPSVVSKDFVLNGNVLALPLNMDSLALFYNKDIFNSKSIISLPTTWDEFTELIIKIREIGDNKKINLPATALGAYKNISVATDVLTALMFQSGSTFVNQNQSGVYFDANAQNGLDFFMQFSDPINSYYTWNEGLGDYISEFALGKLGMIIGYQSDIAKIKAKNPFLNFEVIDLPQIKGASASQKSNVADYWGVAVSSQLVPLKVYASWDFVKHLTTTESVLTTYMSLSGKLPALKSLIEDNISGENGPFLRGALIAKTWQRRDFMGAKKVLGNMISDILSGKISKQQGLRFAQEEINSL
ncbi:MAG: extracellular solute-binding protein [Candidatus Paceibacterota bacterium]|jgi:ABC-type glycerol-3-phosphate transport system substrate-binding protein